jgi:hypothetical protein
MLTKLLLAVAILALIVSPTLAETSANKDGSFTKPRPVAPTEPSTIRYDFQYNTGGILDFVPDTGGSSDGWGEWFITTVYNDSGMDLILVEFGFPCCGPPTEAYGWVVWTDMGGYVAPGGNAYSAEHYGSFTPVDPDPSTFPPTTYTYVDVSAKGIIIPDGTYFCFGYDNTGTGGQTVFNGVNTWAWYEGWWDPDESWGRTAILQVKANYSGTPVTESTWGALKSLFN